MHPRCNGDTRSQAAVLVASQANWAPQRGLKNRHPGLWLVELPFVPLRYVIQSLGIGFGSQPIASDPIASDPGSVRQPCDPALQAGQDRIAAARGVAPAMQ